MPSFEAFSSIADAFLRWLLIGSASATLIAGAVITMQTLFGRWLTPAGRQRLWLLVIVRLLLPILPASALSIGNVHFENLWTTAQREIPANSPAEETPQFVTTIRIKPMSAGLQSVPLMPVAPEVRLRRSWKEFVPRFVFGLWLIGVIALFIRLLWVNHEIARRLRSATAITDIQTLQLLRECASTAGVRTSVRIVVTDAVTTPAVFGILRPRILMPTSLLESLTPAQQRHIMLHEMSHVRHFDVAVNWLLALISIAHWFNPLIGMALARFRSDREVTRDAWVIRVSGATSDADDYASTLVDLAQRISAGPHTHALQLAVPMPGLFGRHVNLRRRLHMIMQTSNSGRRAGWVGAAMLIVIAPMVLTQARAQERLDAAKPSAVRGEVPATTRPASVLPGARTPGIPALIRGWTTDAQTDMADHQYAEALRDVEEILQLDPMNQYAAGVKPLLVEKLQRNPRAEQDKARTLNRVLPSVEFNAVELSDVVDFMRDISGANLFINWKVLDAAGINRTTPVTVTLRKVTFEKALNVILEDAGGKKAKLRFLMDAGVITISTREDLPKNVVIRVYDIRDLLTNAATDATGKGDKEPRQGRIDDLIKIIEESVDPESWKDRGGSVASLRVFDPSGQLIVTQTPENHQALMTVLDGLRARRGLQILLEVEYVDWDTSALSEAMQHWWTHAAQKAPTTQEAAAGVVLPQAQYEMPTRDLRNARWSYIPMASPKLTLLDGQDASVSTIERRSYVSDYALIRLKDGSTRYEPVKATLEPGVDVEATATVTANRQMVKLSVHPKLTTLLEIKSEPWTGRPTDSHLMIESPQLGVAEAQISALVPTGHTLMTAIPRHETGRCLVILIKPTIVFPSPILQIEPSTTHKAIFAPDENQEGPTAKAGMQPGYVDLGSHYPWMKN